METIIIENRDEEKSIVHPQYGKIRYFVLKGKPQMLRADVAVAFGLNASTSSRMYEFTSFRVRREWETPTRATVACIDDEGLKKFAAMGVKNRERRQVVRDWLLRALYGEQIDEPEPLFKNEPVPLTLSPAQMDELTRRVVDLLKLGPLKITLTDKEQDDIAFKVLALIEDMKPNEDALVERVLEKFLGKIAQKK